MAKKELDLQFEIKRRLEMVIHALRNELKAAGVDEYLADSIEVETTTDGVAVNFPDKAVAAKLRDEAKKRAEAEKNAAIEAAKKAAAEAKKKSPPPAPPRKQGGEDDEVPLTKAAIKQQKAQTLANQAEARAITVENEVADAEKSDTEAAAETDKLGSE